MFVRFSDLGPFKSIVNSNPQYVNAPRNLLLDRQGRIVGSRTQAVDMNLGGVAPIPIAPPDFNLEMAAALPDVTSEESDIKAVMQALEEEEPSFGLEEDIRRTIESELERSYTRSIARTAAKRSVMRKKAMKRAALAGIRKNAKDDDVKSGKDAKSAAMAEGLSAAEASAVGRATKKRVKKHMQMEEDEASAIAEEAAGETKTPSSSGSRRGRPAGSKSRVAESPALAGKTKSELSGIVKKLGLAVLGRNKGQMIDQITELSDLSNNPIELLVDAGEGRIPVPPATLQLTKAMEAERKGLFKPAGSKKKRERKQRTTGRMKVAKKERARKSLLERAAGDPSIGY